MSRVILFRAKVLRPDPMTNPESGWVEGFYYQDLCGGEVRHFIKNCPCDWEIDPATLEWFYAPADPKSEFLKDLAECLRRHSAAIFGLELWAKINGETHDFGDVECLDADSITKHDR